MEGTYVQPQAHTHLTRTPARGYVSQFRWSAVFAGAFVALGLWVLLYAFGLAIGLTALDPNQPASARPVGIGTGIWTLVSPLIALFLGGLVSARVAGPIDRGTGAMHGAVLWGFTTVLGVFAVGTLIGSLAGNLGQLTGMAAQQGPQAAQAVGLDSQTLMGPINEQLRQQGKPEMTPQQMQLVLKDISSAGMRQGRVDTGMLAASLQRHTQMSQQDAQDVANNLQKQLSSLGQNVQTGALQAAETSGKAMWGVFFALLLGLVSSVLGATAGVTYSQRAAAHEYREAETRV